jgi:hypothetical protein
MLVEEDGMAPSGKRLFLCALAILVSAGWAKAQDGRWASADDPVAKQLIAMDKMWADGNCAPQPGLKEIFAPEFRGTAPDGRRYDRESAAEFNAKSPDRDCKFGGNVRVQFFGPNLAIAYGTESSIRKRADGSEYQRCLAWTDTWLQRRGKWQIIAAQDNEVACGD